MDDDLRPFEKTLSDIQLCLDTLQKPFAIGKKGYLLNFRCFMIHALRR
ncbi:TPA: hypothetical protein NJ211_004925 [Vibrio parahaemolyticus]|nr:hypothetical protein [Vibrio parahaemolyticus]HCG6702303.1 hypothetical protein [Vibrio parahaemolyticus]HCG6712835.1 hypothetical protein [Vibrio parahaemolyticus]